MVYVEAFIDKNLLLQKIQIPKSFWSHSHFMTEKIYVGSYLYTYEPEEFRKILKSSVKIFNRLVAENNDPTFFDEDNTAFDMKLHKELKTVYSKMVPTELKQKMTFNAYKNRIMRHVHMIEEYDEVFYKLLETDDSTGIRSAWNLVVTDDVDIITRIICELVKSFIIDQFYYNLNVVKEPRKSILNFFKDNKRRDTLTFYKKDKTKNGKTS